MILKDTKLHVADLPFGARVEVTPKTPAELPALEKEAKERAEKISKR